MACFLTFLLQLVAVFGCLTMADPDALEQNSKFLRTTENRDLLGLSYRGDNPTSRLGRCQGDCDDNNDCEGSLVCFFKDAGDDSPVPGCTGTDTSRTDYCIDADDLNIPPSGSPPTSNSSPTRPPNPAPTPHPTNRPNPSPTPNPTNRPNPSPTPNPTSTRRGPSLNNYGSDPRPSAVPLGVCEGDCDDDNDCAGNLICFMRGENAGSVPGCSGSDNSRTDYCIASGGGSPNPPSPTPPNPPPTPNPTPSPNPPTTPSSDIEDFKLKLYWERGYYWQEERRERKWCMRCKGGSCSNGDKLYIERCDRSGVQRFDFVYVNSDEVLIRLHGRNRCLERTGSNIKVRSCDSGDSKQRWIAKRGDFDEDKFEISQDGSNKCITQRHHPKAGEEVELEPCGTARKGDTSYWERCTSNSC